jgi:hypothetical protein
MAQDVSNADILETTVGGRRVDKYSVFAEAAYIEAVDQDIAVLPLGESLNTNTAGLIVLTPAPHYSEITNPNLTTVVDDDPRTIAGINGRGLSRVGADFDRRFAPRRRQPAVSRGKAARDDRRFRSAVRARRRPAVAISIARAAADFRRQRRPDFVVDRPATPVSATRD